MQVELPDHARTLLTHDDPYRQTDRQRKRGLQTRRVKRPKLKLIAVSSNTRLGIEVHPLQERENVFLDELKPI